MLNGKVYVITNTDLINPVNRNSRALAFNPFIAQVGKRITGHDEATGRIIQHNLNGENGPGYVPEIHDGSLVALADSKNIDNMTYTMLQEISKLEPGTEIDLFSWIRQTFTRCGTTGIYGPENPLTRADEELIGAFWFVNGTALSALKVDPSIGILTGISTLSCLIFSPVSLLQRQIAHVRNLALGFKDISSGINQEKPRALCTPIQGTVSTPSTAWILGMPPVWKLELSSAF